jgi:glycosyltransferase involved in cell wall biosynthesis
VACQGGETLRSSFSHGVSVVVPVFRSGPTLSELVDRVGLALADTPHEVVLVDDGSPESTWEVVRSLATERDHVRALRLGRNFGQHNALVAGVRSAGYDVTVTIDDDLQNPPEEIPALLAALQAGLDVVYGSPFTASQDRWRRLAGRLSRWAMAGALGAENASRMTSFRAFRTDLRRAFDGEVGPSVSLDALLSWGTSSFGSVEVRHDARQEGSSNYSFRRLLRFAIDTATGYSALPLQMATTVGFATAVFGLGLLAWVLGRLVVEGGSAPGFPFLASAIAIFSGVQLMTLGIMGEYLARMHFRLMRKPTYVVAEEIGLSQVVEA